MEDKVVSEYLTVKLSNYYPYKGSGEENNRGHNKYRGPQLDSGTVRFLDYTYSVSRADLTHTVAKSCSSTYTTTTKGSVRPFTGFSTLGKPLIYPNIFPKKPLLFPAKHNII